jgi:hypothetical protein
MRRLICQPVCCNSGFTSTERVFQVVTMLRATSFKQLMYTTRNSKLHFFASAGDLQDWMSSTTRRVNQI